MTHATQAYQYKFLKDVMYPDLLFAILAYCFTLVCHNLVITQELDTTTHSTCETYIDLTGWRQIWKMYLCEDSHDAVLPFFFLLKKERELQVGNSVHKIVTSLLENQYLIKLILKSDHAVLRRVKEKLILT